MKKFVILIASLFVFCSFLQNAGIVHDEFENDDTLSLIFTGDIMGHSPQFQAAYNPDTKTYNYDICFQHVKPYIEEADFAIANLEVPLAGAPYSGYPNFSSPDALLDGLKYAGYDIILTANNHVVDRGKRGLERTIRTIKNRELLHAGSYIDKAQYDSVYPLILEQKGVKIALLNCTYGTNGIPVTLPNIVNMLDTVQIKKDIRKARTRNVDLVVMTVHWGNEYELNANIEQRKMARFFVREGVDLIVGGHPHVVQNAEYLTVENKMPIPVIYSLGNSISNQRKPHTDGGIMVKVEIGTKLKQIIKTSYLPVYVHKGVLSGKYQYHLIPTVDYVKTPANFPLSVADSLSLTYFDKETRKRLENMIVWDSSSEWAQK